MHGYAFMQESIYTHILSSSKPFLNFNEHFALEVFLLNIHNINSSYYCMLNDIMLGYNRHEFNFHQESEN